MKDRIISELNKIKIEFSNAVKKQGEQRVVAYLYIIFSLVAVTVFGAFAIRPTLATISELKREQEDSEFLLQQLERKESNLRSLEVEYQTLGTKIDDVYTAIPSSPRIPELTRKIEILANRNNLAISTLTTGSIELYPAERIGDSLFSYTFTVTVLGTETSINRFIQELITIDRIIAIERITSGRAERDVFSGTITGRAFFLKD